MSNLIKDYDHVDLTAFEDVFLCLAKSVENSLILAGATPGKDYTILDCYKLAQPFMLAQFRKPGLHYSAGL